MWQMHPTHKGSMSSVLELQPGTFGQGSEHNYDFVWYPKNKFF